MCASKLGIWKILIFFSETTRTRTGAMQQLVGNSGFREPHHIHYSPQYDDKRGDNPQKRFDALINQQTTNA